MIKSLSALSDLSYADKDLVHDLMFIIKNIAEDKFVQAILSFQPFKPKFRPMKFLDLESKKKGTGSNPARAVRAAEVVKFWTTGPKDLGLVPILRFVALLFF